MARVELDSVRASYGDRVVLAGIRLALEPGTLTVLLGPNGSGKSTLLRTVAGLGPQVSGSVRVGGDEVSSLSRRDLARRLAFVPQRTGVPHGFAVREVVAMGRAPHQEGWLSPSEEDERIVDESLGFCELRALAERPIETLSGGEQQRVHVARALAQGASVLLLDEAAAHLDIRHARGTHDLLRRLVRERGIACLAAMHDLNAAARFADRIGVLSDGRLIAEGPVEEAMTPGVLEAAFGVPVVASRAPDGTLLFSAS